MKTGIRNTSSYIGFCLAALTFVATPAPAFEFSSESGELTGSFDTTVSLGSAWRTQSRDPALVAITNGGTSRSPNEDDGNLNYDKRDAVFGVAKATHDLELNYKNYGAFFRGYYFYDWVNHDKDGLTPEAKDIAGSDAKFLDAYVRGKFDIADRALNVRAGNQVVSWGESTFISNGINVVNAVDVTKLRIPGSELKEALVPSPMLWGAQELTDQTSAEAFVLTNFDKTRLEPRGTFFSTNDFLSDGGDKVYVGFGRRRDQHQSPGTFGVDADAAAWAPRSPDRNPSDSGQYGLAFRWFAPELNNTEFGLYHLNYHSRTPIVSGYRGGLTAVTPVPGCSAFDLPTLLGGGGFPAACTNAAGRSGTYFAEYPESIKLYGLGFNTSVAGGVALQGEYSYRPNQPLQLASPEILLAALGLKNNITGGDAAAAAVPYGTEISGYRRVQMQQVQFTGTKAFGPMLKAEQFAVVVEVGYTHLNLPEGLLFNGPGVYLPGPGSSTTTSGGSSQTEGYATRDSWGYRLRTSMDFPNAIGVATLSPRLVYSHDVKGVSPTFNEGTKAVTLGFGLNYKQNWQADLAYTNFFGGRTYSGTDPSAAPTGQSQSYASSANPLKDRDFVALSVSYSF